MLYDNTICTGCNACVVACSEANGLPPDTALSGGLWQMPSDLNSKTKNTIKLYKQPDGALSAFVKRQCMHCLDPACVAGCPFGSLKKNRWGAVTWDGSLCIGCRYCELACPFDIPKFEWDKWNPKIVKCEFCFDQRLVKNKPPACAGICPTGAVIFGTRANLLARAKSAYCGISAQVLRKAGIRRDGGGRNPGLSISPLSHSTRSACRRWVRLPLLITQPR